MKVDESSQTSSRGEVHDAGSKGNGLPGVVAGVL